MFSRPEVFILNSPDQTADESPHGVNAGVNLQQFSGVKVQHGRRQEGSRYIGGLLA